MFCVPGFRQRSLWAFNLLLDSCFPLSPWLRKMPPGLHVLKNRTRRAVPPPITSVDHNCLLVDHGFLWPVWVIWKDTHHVLGSTNLPMWLIFPEDTWNISFNKTAAESGVGCGNQDQLRKPCVSCGNAAIWTKILNQQ